MRLRSTVCSTQVVVVRSPMSPVDLRCGGVSMVAFNAGPSGAPAVNPDGPGTQLGKRYADENAGIELLCVKPGGGSLSLGDTVLPLKDAKPLPSSD
jgi:hypothetical protein